MPLRKDNEKTNRQKRTLRNFTCLHKISQKKKFKKKDCETKNFYEVEKKDKEIENTRTK